MGGPILLNVTTLYIIRALRARRDPASRDAIWTTRRETNERTNERRIKRTVTEGEMSSESSTRVRARKGKIEKEKKK